tara:strand:- start:19 stop:327 length:309 start_codon:yes stop_codon:yes gene_type:complete
MVKIFTYGSLMDHRVRFNVLGYSINGINDILDNYMLTDHSVFKTAYPAIIPQNNSKVNGLVFEVKEDDIIKLDRYESDLYKKIKIKTRNNIECLVYIENKIE